jgi:hypothetical protein
MGSHDQFGYLKQKLWPKERSGVKLAIWHLIDFWPLKVKDCSNFLACKWHDTYCWKALDEGYNFNWDLILIRGLHTKLWASKVVGVPILGILGLPLENPETKWHLGVGPMAKHKEYYKGEGGSFPRIQAVVNFVSSCLHVVCPCTKSASTLH